MMQRTLGRFFLAFALLLVLAWPAPRALAADAVSYKFVLETKQGWFPRNHVTTGMIARTEHGSLRDTFIGNR